MNRRLNISPALSSCIKSHWSWCIVLFALLGLIYSHVVEDFNIFVHTHVGTFPLPHCFLSALGSCWPHLHELDSVPSDSQVRMGQGLSRYSSR